MFLIEEVQMMHLLNLTFSRYLNIYAEKRQ